MTLNTNTVSLPTRGEWIEITASYVLSTTSYRLSPHGESGLKFILNLAYAILVESLPTRGEWIEILSKVTKENFVNATLKVYHIPAKK